jgi:hypothetical protein
MKEAKVLMPANEIIDGLISKEIIGMLAPPESIPKYEQAYINTIPNDQVRTLMTQENEQIQSRDLGTQIPTRRQFGEQEVPEDDVDADGLDGSGVMPINTGQSYNTEQAIAVQLAGINTGR